MSLLLDIAPADLGLPHKFTEYRPTQADGIDFAVRSEKRFIAARADTGIGKSLLAMTVAKAQAVRAVYLTATKGLQEQILGDFAPCGVRDIRGRANYSCRPYTKRLKHATTCEEGAERGCSHFATTGCPYSSAYMTVCASALSTTNYAYWLHIRRAYSQMGMCEDDEKPIDLLICDEAHHILDQLAGFLQIKLPDKEYGKLVSANQNGLMSDHSGGIWQRWAAGRIKEGNATLKELRDKHGSTEAARARDDDYAYLERLQVRLRAISSMDSNWTWETSDDAVSFDPIWPGRYAHLLWSGVSKVLLLSATICPYTLGLLGLVKGDYDYGEFTNGWPPNYGVTYYIPTARMSYRSTEADYRRMVERIDEIIAGRLDRKGIIHTISYKRMRTFLDYSRYAKYMITNQSANGSISTAARYRDSKPPAILCSPSYGTGWDFAYDQCEYIIIPKVPFPYAETRVMQERNKDAQYRIYCAILEMIQMIGRGRRAHDDRCETFILDNNFPLVMAKGKPYAPRSFTVHKSNKVPSAPKKIHRNITCI